MQKKGLSDVINTVMLVALTIVAMGIIWVAIMPMIKDRMGSSDSCLNADVSIEVSKGYTCWDSAQEIVMVQVKTGNIDVNVSGFKFFVSSDGNSIRYPKESYISPNSYNVFFLNSTGISNIDGIGVAAVIRSGRTVRDCPSVFVNEITSCSGLETIESSQILNSA